MPKRKTNSDNKRLMQTAFNAALGSNANDENLKGLFDEFGVSKSNRNYASAIACAGIKKAVGGDKSWAEFIKNMVLSKSDEPDKKDTSVVIVDDISSK